MPLFLYLGWKFPPRVEKTEGFHTPKIRFYHPFENYDFPPRCVAYGVRKKKGCQWMQIWFSCLYDSDLRREMLRLDFMSLSRISGTVSEGEDCREKTGKTVCERKDKTGEANPGCDEAKEIQDERTCVWKIDS